jgi:hypothetical protein
MSDSRRHRQQEMTDGDNMVLLEEELESVEDDLDSDELDEEEPTLCWSCRRRDASTGGDMYSVGT